MLSQPRDAAVNFYAYRILIILHHRAVSLSQHGFVVYTSDHSKCWYYTQYTNLHGRDAKSRRYRKSTVKVTVIVNTWLSYTVNKCYNKCSCLRPLFSFHAYNFSIWTVADVCKKAVLWAVAEKPHDAVVKFDTNPNLQWHRAVLPAIARLSCCILLSENLREAPTYAYVVLYNVFHCFKLSDEYMKLHYCIIAVVAETVPIVLNFALKGTLKHYSQ